MECIYCLSFSKAAVFYRWAPCECHNASRGKYKPKRESYVLDLAADYCNWSIRMKAIHNPAGWTVCSVKRPSSPIHCICIAPSCLLSPHLNSYHNFLSSLLSLALNEQCHYSKHTNLPVLKRKACRQTDGGERGGSEDVFFLSILVR